VVSSSRPIVFIFGVYTMVADLQHDAPILRYLPARSRFVSQGRAVFFRVNEGRPTERVYWVNQALTVLD
jgi:hypothetical protein